jgi:hypothetical protein
MTEYGYGYWLRFMVAYPKRMIDGKNAPWYIISRMSKNKQGSDIGVGDRTLAIWQGVDFYHFTTYNIAGEANIINNIQFDDIDGVWTFLYFSYSLND